MSEWPAALGQVKVQRTSPTFPSGWRKRNRTQTQMHSNSTRAKSQVPVSPEQGELREEAGGAGGPTKHREGRDLRMNRICPRVRRLSKGPRQDRAEATRLRSPAGSPCSALPEGAPALPRPLRTLSALLPPLRLNNAPASLGAAARASE